MIELSYHGSTLRAMVVFSAAKGRRSELTAVAFSVILP
jgi:hypothetical protein